MNARELKMSPEALVAEQARQKAARASRSRRTAGKKAPGREAKKAKRERGAAFYEDAKRLAAERAKDPIGIRCEYRAFSDRRCETEANDPDHVLGGASRKECERLGAEGLMCLCRYHHDLKHAGSPTRGFWLDVAHAHALRHGYKRLLSLVARARAKYEGKRTIPVRIEVES